MSREKMLSWLDGVKSRKIPNGASTNKNLGTFERILDDNRRRGKSVSFTQEDVEFEIFQGGAHRHEFVDVELKGELNDAEEGPKLRKRFVIAVEEKLDGDFTGQLTKVKAAEMSRAEEARVKHRIGPARTKLSSCKRALKKFLNSPGKSGLFSSPGKNRKTRLVNEEAIEPKTSDLRNSRDSGWEEMTSLSSSLASLTIEEDAGDFWASSPLCRGKDGCSPSPSSSSVEQEKHPTSAKDKIDKNLSRVPSQRGVRTMLKFGNADSVSYRRLAEPSRKSLSSTNVEASADSSRQRDKCLRRKSDSDVLLKAARRSTENSELGRESYDSGNLAPSRLKRGDSLTEFLLGGVGDAKFELISTIFPGCVDDKAEESRSRDEQFSNSMDRGERRISAVSASSTSDFSVDSLEDPGEKKLAPISAERLDEAPLDCLGRGREHRGRISHSNSAPELFEKELSLDCEDEIEHFASLDNLSSVLSRREGEENSSMAPIDELRDYGDEDDFSRSYSCLEDDYTIDMNNSSYIITMYV